MQDEIAAGKVQPIKHFNSFVLCQTGECRYPWFEYLDAAQRPVSPALSGVSIREVQGVRMRPINIKPASVVGGSVTATSAFLISFSRTMLPDPSDVLLGAG